ncbi:MAG: EexN family lipoprotein [Gammaproteobacteria bacterium]
MKSTTRNVMVLLSASVMVFACSREEEPARTVSWFQQHPDERKAMVARCADDPGRLAKTPNCVNAQQAESIEGIGSFRKLPPVGLDPNYKPRFEDDGKSKPRP